MSKVIRKAAPYRKRAWSPAAPLNRLKQGKAGALAAWSQAPVGVKRQNRLHPTPLLG
ncbi:MAG: hypothetical protein LBQ18_05250 [Campylobacteraceae bacterium]|nr:hypothetical protein [Campylobacteraceae bacterium]